MNDILKTALNGDLEKLKEMISSDKNLINRQDEDGRNVLHYASIVLPEQLENLAFAISPHINVTGNEFLNNDKASKIIEYLESKRQTVKYLVNLGMNVNHQDIHGRTPLISNLELLVNLENIPNLQFIKTEKLENLVYKKNIETALFLIQSGTNLDIKGNGNTALMLASAKDFFEIVKLLVDSHVSTNAKSNQTYNTALHIATMRGSFEIANYIASFSENVNLNAKNIIGYTPLIYASIRGFFDIAQVLVDKKADLDLSDNFGDTALIHASSKGHGDIVKLLVENGANVKLENSHGKNALFYAQKNQHHEILNYLI